MTGRRGHRVPPVPGDPVREAPAFDAVASAYDAQLARGLALTGEAKEYFAAARVAAVARLLPSPPASFAILDFGCGTGSAVPHLMAQWPVTRLRGVDVSPRSIAEATQQYGARPELSFGAVDEETPRAAYDLAFSNGVFHHIPPAHRPAAVRWVAARLRLGGWFALWENTPWNPGTRLVMRRIPFDRDAELLTPAATRHLLRAAGFAVVATRYHFVFPHVLRAARVLEPWVTRVPIGGQYLVLAQRRS